MPGKSLTVALLALAVGACAPTDVGPGAAGDAPAPEAGADATRGIPRFEVDAAWQWPPALPDGAAVGVVTYVAVDRHDHVWVLHRSRQVPADRQHLAAPPVLEFDANGNFVQAWGGPADGYDWPDTEHGLFVDHEDNVWVTGLNPLEQSYADPTDRTDDMIPQVHQPRRVPGPVRRPRPASAGTGRQRRHRERAPGHGGGGVPGHRRAVRGRRLCEPQGARPGRADAAVQAHVGRVRQPAAARPRGATPARPPRRRTWT